jgi:hypothetical protein
MTLSAKQAVEKSLLTLGAPHVVTTQDLNAYAEFETGARPAPATVTRMANALTKTGALQRVSRTVYLNKLAGPTVQLAEAAQLIRRGAVVSLAWVLERSGALNNFGDIVTCVVPLVVGMAPPRVGEHKTLAGQFRFYGMPIRIVNCGAAHVEDVQDVRYAYPRATPERALMDWIYLGSSPHSRLPLPPLDIQLHGMNQPRLKRLSKVMGLESEWAHWYCKWQKRESTDDVRENASLGLGF